VIVVSDTSPINYLVLIELQDLPAYCAPSFESASASTGSTYWCADVSVAGR